MYLYLLNKVSMFVNLLFIVAKLVTVLCANNIQTFQNRRMRGSCVGDDSDRV